MKSSKMIKTIKIIFIIMQVAALIPAVVLEYLSDKKMGVMRYLVFKKRIYEESTFNANLMKIYIMLLIGMAIISFLMLIYNIVKAKNSKLKNIIMNSFVINLMGIIFIVWKKTLNLQAYHFFLISVFIIIVLQYAKLVFIWGVVKFRDL